MSKIVNVPWLPFGWDGLALKPFVFIRNYSPLLLCHEYVHIEQQNRYGLFKYLWRYVMDPDFRVLMEYDAYRLGSQLSSEQARAMAENYRGLF